ncbi:MAG: pilus assembly protein TadG-related protein [Parasphingorhabdus sp.]|uniref:pilus assembly protein TadG-related protein n=1 Tax=Parasphingorhabdus sp. TaxID=2709688 RepID=UPI003298A5A6
MVTNNEKKLQKSFLQKLRSDTTGNTIAMAAAAIFPIVGVIGGGVDIGRGYMAKARLQQACDAGALAGRRSMTADTMEDADKVQARKFFDFNFPEGSFGTDPFVKINGEDNPRFVDGVEPRTVDGFAQTQIPTTLMKVFGNDYMTVKVSCVTRLDVGNVDVMMVLDLSGSMDWKPNGQTTSVETEKRIHGLREAVKDFYGTLGTGGGGGAVNNQIRYGFVNYNSHVNVGELLHKENAAWLVGGTGVEADDRWSYQTRRGTWEVPNPNYIPPDPNYDPRTDSAATPISTTTDTDYELLTQLDGPECTTQFGQNQSVPGYWTANPSGNPIVTLDTSGQYSVLTTVTYSYHSWDGSTGNPPSNAVGSAYWKDCEREVVTDVETYEKQGGNGEPEFITVDKWQSDAVSFSGWEYGQFTHDVSEYVASIDSNEDPVQRPTENGLRLDRWAGCIEERDTDATITKDSTVITDAALDLDIDLVPTDTASRWRPLWPGVEYKRNGDSVGGSQCTTPSRRLAQYDSITSPGLDSNGDEVGGNLTTYIDNLTATGATNHTIGMIWGARLLSENGLFATENQYTGNGFPIGRHLVFMTDGAMNFNGDRYNVYGYNQLDGRIAPTGTNNNNMDDIQENRFQLICQAIRNQGVTIWVVQFGVNNVTQAMEDCASSADHAAPATDNDSLQAAFSNIAKTIGGLRVSQ